MPHPALEWAASGGMYLTGWPSSPLVPPVDVLGAARTMAAAFEEAASVWGRPVGVDVATVLFGRAALAGYERAGRTSVGGTCRLLEAADGWAAVNLPRPEDVESVPAVVAGGKAGTEPWEALERCARESSAESFVARCQLLGIPAAALPPKVSPRLVESPVPPRSTLDSRNLETSGASGGQPVVVDLSAMWAGPLCAKLLGDVGARVIKVESTRRPDGARAGDPVFYDWLHAGHESVVLDFADASDLRVLRALIADADVVIEASRPRALKQLGIDADQVVASIERLTWVSITGYGRTGPHADRVAFGDDAAVAGGLVAFDDDGKPVFCGDAIADPLTGLHAAAEAAGSIASGGGGLIDVAMARVAASVPAMPAGYTVMDSDVLPPRAPAPTGARAPAAPR